MHDDFIAALGGTNKVAEVCNVEPSAVSNWRKRGVSWKHRHYLATIAQRKGVPLPEGYWQP